MSKLLGILLIIVSATSFGAMPIFAHFVYASGVTPLTALFFRFGIAALCLWSYMLLQQQSWPQRKNLKILMAIGGVGFVFQSITFFVALTLVSGGLVVLLLYLYPTIVVAISIVVLRQPSSPMKLLALMTALTGTALTIGPVEKAQFLGVILGILSAFIYATYVLVGDRVMQEESPLVSSTVMISAAAFVFGGIAVIQGVSLPTHISGWLGLIAIAVISTVVSISTLFTGIKLLGAATASVLSTLEPVVTIALSFVILQQQITQMQLLGGGLIVLAVLLITLEKPTIPASE